MEAAGRLDKSERDPVWSPRLIGSGESISPSDRVAVGPAGGTGRMDLTDELSTLRGVGPKTAAAAEEDFDIRTLSDLLRHLPRMHRDLAEVTPLGEVLPGQEVTVAVEIRSSKLRPTRKRRLTILEAEVADASGAVGRIIWFNRPWLADRLEPGTKVLARGKLGKRGFVVAEHEFLGSGDLPGRASESADEAPGSDRVNLDHWVRRGSPGDPLPEGLHTTGLVPVYPASERVRPQRLREWAWQATGLARGVPEPFPGRVRANLGLPSSADALVGAHLPPNADALETSRKALAFEELALYQAILALRRKARRAGSVARPLGERPPSADEWSAGLPFELTGDQSKAIETLERDLTSEVPMQRLLMGEVGSGKTVVALYAMLRAIWDGGQAALMAPTETLAEQHFQTLVQLAGGDGPPIHLLTGSVPEMDRTGPLTDLADGVPMIVVGTHALIEPTVEFSSLRVAVVDEQHRFGVRQRVALDRKGEEGRAPHTLHMTATPIPRTLSLTAYGDLDTTALRELPANRKPVETRVVGDSGRAREYEFVRSQLKAGRQAFVVCPLVTESALIEAKAAEEEARRLSTGEFEGFGVAVLHGQLSSEEKQKTMAEFAAGGTDVLVATSVIEVGIDVPNATVMLIEGAERFGLSQLHQLRGRVGRGEHASTCLLFGEMRSDAARTRLEAIEKERDGFRLAEVDLELRGEGELLGTRQHGLPRFSAASLPRDLPILESAREVVARLLEGDPVERDLLLAAARERFGDERDDRLSA